MLFIFSVCWHKGLLYKELPDYCFHNNRVVFFVMVIKVGFILFSNTLKYILEFLLADRGGTRLFLCPF